MRERLVAALVGMTVAVIALYGIPRAYVLADLVQGQEERKLERSVDLVAVVLEDRVRTGVPVDEGYLEPLLHDQEHLEYVVPGGPTVTVGAELDDRDDHIASTRRLAGGGEVTLTRDGGLIDRRVSEALFPLVALGLGLVLVSRVVGFILSRRLARPFQELAEAAGRLGRGRFDLRIPNYGVPEADQIGSALRRGAEQLGELVQREREFAVNASHQLRTPVTALRLSLEDLSMWPETSPAVATELQEALVELDRLSAAVSDLLELARGKRMGAAIDIDLAALVAETVQRWRSTLQTEGRTLLHESPGVVPAHLTPGPVIQILDVLVQNALDHGSGSITVDTEALATHLRVRVADEGVRAFDSEVFRRGVSGARSEGTGVGLAVAAELAESLGGFLSLDAVPFTRFVLMLPMPSPPTPPSPV